MWFYTVASMVVTALVLRIAGITTISNSGLSVVPIFVGLFVGLLFLVVRYGRECRRLRETLRCVHVIEGERRGSLFQHEVDEQLQLQAAQIRNHTQALMLLRRTGYEGFCSSQYTSWCMYDFKSTEVSLEKELNEHRRLFYKLYNEFKDQRVELGLKLNDRPDWHSYAEETDATEDLQARSA